MSLPSPHAGQHPARLGRYDLIAPLGVGGAATVFVGRATGIGGFSRDVAVKILHTHLRLDAAYVADFLREARIAARIRHPNVLPVVDVGEEEAAVYLVMDWVDGVSLAELMERVHAQGAAMPIDVAVRVAADALAGLHAAHEMSDVQGRPLGLVHRDVSPHNLLISAAGTVLLTDFGIAKPTELPGHTRTGIVKGKLAYMAPEQLRAKLLDRRVDLWAVGIILWELLAGARAYGDSDEAVLVQRVAGAAVPDLRTRRADLPAALLRVVETALAPLPEDRWPSADAFRTALLEAARAAGSVADASEVGTYVTSTLGDVIEERRELVRRPVPAAAVPPTGARGAEGPVAPTTTVSRNGTAVLAVVAAAVAAVAVASVWWVSSPPQPARVAPTLRERASSPPSPPPPPRPVLGEGSASGARKQDPSPSAPAAPQLHPEARAMKPNRQRREAPSQAVPARAPTAPDRGAVPPLADNPYNR